MNEDPFGKLVEQAEEAMNDFIGRLARAQKISRVVAPAFLRNLRDDYIENIRAKRYKEATEALASFTRIAQSYRERAKSNDAYIRHWTAYEDQRLRKPIARLMRLTNENQKWEAMRRLKSPPDRSNFFQPPSGAPVRITDLAHTPIYDSFVSLPDPKPVDHRVLVAVGLYRKSPSQLPRT